MLPVMLNHVSKGKLSYEKLIDLLAYGPIRVHKIKNKCEIKEGNDADFTIVDPNMTHIIKNEEQASKSGWTPYDNKKVKGFPMMTIIRGKKVMHYLFSSDNSHHWEALNLFIVIWSPAGF